MCGNQIHCKHSLMIIYGIKIIAYSPLTSWPPHLPYQGPPQIKSTPIPLMALLFLFPFNHYQSSTIQFELLSPSTIIIFGNTKFLLISMPKTSLAIMLMVLNQSIIPNTVTWLNQPTNHWRIHYRARVDPCPPSNIFFKKIIRYKIWKNNWFYKVSTLNFLGNSTILTLFFYACSTFNR